MAEENTASDNSNVDQENDEVSTIVQSWNRLPGCIGEELWEKTKKLFHETALLILGVNWPDIPVVAKSKLTLVLHKCVQEASQSCAKSKALIDALSDLMLDPWGNASLLEILNSNYEGEEKNALYEYYCKTENPAVTWLRLKILQENNCQDLALKLCVCCLHCIAFHDERKLNDLHTRLLFHQGHMEQLVNKLSSYSCHEGLEIINRILTEDDSFSLSLAEYVTRILLVKDMLHTSEYCCTQKLMTKWVDLLIQRKIDLNSIQRDVLTLCTLSVTSAHFYLMADILYNRFGNELLRLHVELYIRALTVDINFLENIRLTNNAEATLEMEVHVANTLCKLAFLLEKYPKLARECLLTAFSIDPSKERLSRLEMYAEKETESEPVMLKSLLPIVPCSGECHCVEKGECRRLLKEAGIKIEDVNASDLTSLDRDENDTKLNAKSSLTQDSQNDAEDMTSEDAKSEECESENGDDNDICMEAENLLMTSLYTEDSKEFSDGKVSSIPDQESQSLEIDNGNVSNEVNKLPSFMLFAESPVTTVANVGQWNIPLYNSSPSLTTNTVGHQSWFSVENNYISKNHDPSHDIHFSPISNICEKSIISTGLTDKWDNNTESIYHIHSHILDSEIEGVDQGMLKDLTIVLDEPRNKVLSWDLDWEELKQRCQLYLETKSAFKSIIQATLFSGKSPPIFYIKNTVHSPLKQNIANIDISYHTEGDDVEMKSCTVNTLTLKKLFQEDEEVKPSSPPPPPSPPLEDSSLSETESIIKEKFPTLRSVNVKLDKIDITAIKNMNPTVVISHSDIVDAEKQLFVESPALIKLKSLSKENSSLTKELSINTNLSQKSEKESPVLRSVLLGTASAKGINTDLNSHKTSAKSNSSCANDSEDKKSHSNESRSKFLSTTSTSFPKDNAINQILLTPENNKNNLLEASDVNMNCQNPALSDSSEQFNVRNDPSVVLVKDVQQSNESASKIYVLPNENNTDHCSLQQCAATSTENATSSVIEPLQDNENSKQKNSKDPIMLTLIKPQDLLSSIPANKTSLTNSLQSHVLIKSVSQLPIAVKLQSLVPTADSCFAKQMNRLQDDPVRENSESNISIPYSNPSSELGGAVFCTESGELHILDSPVVNSSNFSSAIPGRTATHDSEIKVSQAVLRPISSVPSISQLTQRGTSSTLNQQQIQLFVSENQSIPSLDSLSKTNEEMSTCENQSTVPTLLYTNDGNNLILCSSVFPSCLQSNISSNSTIPEESALDHTSEENSASQCDLNKTWPLQTQIETNEMNINRNLPHENSCTVQEEDGKTNMMLCNSLNQNLASSLHESASSDVTTNVISTLNKPQTCVIKIVDFNHNSNQVELDKDIFSTQSQSMLTEFSSSQNYIESNPSVFNPVNSTTDSSTQLVIPNIQAQNKNSIYADKRPKVLTSASQSNSQDFEANYKRFLLDNFKQKQLLKESDNPSLEEPSPSIEEPSGPITVCSNSLPSKSDCSKSAPPPRVSSAPLPQRANSPMLQALVETCTRLYETVEPNTNSKKHKTLFSNKNDKKWISVRNQHGIMEYKKAQCKSSKYNFFNIQSPIVNNVPFNNMQAPKRKTQVTAVGTLKTTIPINTLTTSTVTPTSIANTTISPSKCTVTNAGSVCVPSVTTTHSQMTTFIPKTPIVNPVTIPTSATHVLKALKHLSPLQQSSSSPPFISSPPPPQVAVEAALPKENIPFPVVLQTTENQINHQMNSQNDDHIISNDDDVNINIPNPSDLKCEIPTKLLENPPAKSTSVKSTKEHKPQGSKVQPPNSSSKKSSSKKKKSSKSENPKPSNDYVMKVSQIIQSIQQEQKLNETKHSPEKKKKSDSSSKSPKSPNKKEPKPKEEKLPTTSLNKPECTLCHKSFCSSFSLRRHMQKLHKVVENGATQNNKMDDSASVLPTSNANDFSQRSLDVSFQSVKSDDDKVSMDEQSSNFYFESNITDACPLDKTTVDYNDSICTEQNQSENYETLSNHFTLFSDPEPEENYLDKYNYDKNSFGTISASAYNLFSDPEAEENPLESSLDDESVFMSTMDESLIMPSYLERTEEVERTDVVNKCENTSDDVSQTLEEEIISISDKNLTSRSKDWARDDTSTEGSVDSMSFTKGRTRSRISKVANKRCCPCCESSTNQVSKKCRKDGRGTKQTRSPSKRSKDSKRSLNQQDSSRTRNLHKR